MLLKGSLTQGIHFFLFTCEINIAAKKVKGHEEEFKYFILKRKEDSANIKYMQTDACIRQKKNTAEIQH